MTEQLTLYTTKGSPYADSVEIALKEAKLEFTRYSIDLENKPEWFASQINPASKVPAITYGGPKVSPDQPSAESHKIAESVVILEFIADISGKLLPKDPVKRARARFFIDTVIRSYVPAFYSVILRGESVEILVKALETIQALLPEEGYVAGPEFSIADAAVASLSGIVDMALGGGGGAYDEDEGRKAYELLQKDQKFVRYRRYFRDIQARDSYKSTFDGEYIKERFSKSERLATIRAERKAAKLAASS